MSNNLKGEVKTFGHPRFHQLLEEIGELHNRKNADYAGGHDPLANLRGSERLGIEAWKGVLVRLGDKFDRINNLALRNGVAEVKDESIIDTLMDNAVYSLLCIILYEERKQGKN